MRYPYKPDVVLNKYGLLRETFHLMYRKQQGRCAICFIKMNTSRNCCIDHDHKTGQVRGLLCAQCNLGLGCFKDNPRNLAFALVYLESYGITYEDSVDPTDDLGDDFDGWLEEIDTPEQPPPGTLPASPPEPLGQ